MIPRNTLLANIIYRRTVQSQRAQNRHSLQSSELGLESIHDHRYSCLQFPINMLPSRTLVTKRQKRISEAKQKDKSKMKKNTKNDQQILQTEEDITIHAVKPNKVKDPKYNESITIPPSLSTTLSMSPSYKQMDPKEQFLFLKDQLEKSASSSSTSTENIISVNDEDLFNSEIHLRDIPDFMNSSLNYEDGTPLSDQLIKRIGLRYEVSLCLT